MKSQMADNAEVEVNEDSEAEADNANNAFAPTIPIGEDMQYAVRNSRS